MGGEKGEAGDGAWVGWGETFSDVSDSTGALTAADLSQGRRSPVSTAK